MEKLRSVKIPFILCLILLVLFSSLLLSSAYTLPDRYFVNCGSEKNTTFGGRTFVSDHSFSPNQVSSAKSSNLSSPDLQLYETASVFYRKSSLYQFDITQTGTYMVRLHFFVFSSVDHNLTNALFNVRARGIFLLSNFSVPKNTNSPVVKEFMLHLDRRKFRIHFIPSRGSLAFVNGIEVFLAPENFIPEAAPNVTSDGSKGNYSGLLSHVLHTIYRINVGGANILEGDDTLLRNWIPDDNFLTHPETSKNISTAQDIEYAVFIDTQFNIAMATKYIAPTRVYSTARELNNGESNFSSINWAFNVSKNASYLLRAHVHAILANLPDVLEFNLNIYSNFSQNIRPYAITGVKVMPFYMDFVVGSDNSGVMNVSVNRIRENAILNGLEIIKILGRLRSEKEKTNRITIIGSLGGGVFLLLLIVLLLFLVFLARMRRKPYQGSARPFSVPIYGGSFLNRLLERSSEVSLPPDLKLALKKPYREILRATNKFDSKLLIGEGGFGKVYKGTLSDGTKVAVKRSQQGHGQGISEFQNEIIVLSQIQHRYLVDFIGYCDEKSEMILVYEFMEKGTLRDHLYLSDGEDEKCAPRSELSWKQRLQICIDSAKGLHYLHTGLPRRIIHRDVKSTNILLNEYYIAKVADFGLSKSSPTDADQDFTGVKGSLGYLDPEYLMSGQLTEKSDVYSFGVVLLEVLCARPVIVYSAPQEEVSLRDWGMLWHKKGQLEKIIDPTLVGNINSSSLQIFGDIAAKCLRADGAERPTMHDVLYDLEYALEFQEKAMHKEPQEDSTINASSEFALKIGHRLPSRFSREEEGTSSPKDDNESVTAASVFTQLGIDGGR